MAQLVTLLLIGFSLPAIALLLAAQWSVHRGTDHTWLTRGAGGVLLLGLAALQWLHAEHLLHGRALQTPLYIGVLFLVAPAFFLFFRGALRMPGSEHPLLLLHFVPALIAPWLDPHVAIPLSFAIGTAYALRLSVMVSRLRAQRRRFGLELRVFLLFAVVALAVLLLGLGLPWLGLRWFVLGYASLIGLALWLALYLLLRFPDLPGQAAEAVRAAYAVSTLTRVDRDAAVSRLDQRMTQDRLYTDEALSLASLAAAVELTPHQLSELINTQFGVGFSRYLRERRVAAAQRMLLDEPQASVLSVGLAVGFSSQSNFYVAFRDITGEVPGRFRSRMRSTD